MSLTGERCPLCDTPGSVWLVRQGVPVHQNRVWSSASAARGCPSGDLTLARCPSCGFVWNVTFDPERLSYDGHYDNRQACSRAFRAYMQDLARHLVRGRGLEGATALEVGCGKGEFLELLVDAGLADGVGVDSSYEGPLQARDGRLRFIREHLRGPLPGLAPRLVVSRHVIEHVPHPLDLLQAIAAQVEAAPGAHVFVETPTLRWILTGGVFWDLFYEHCSYFDTTTLPWACARAGLSPVDVREAFEGQYQWVECRLGPDGVAPTPSPEVTAGLVERYGRRARRVEARVAAAIDAHAGRAGGVAVWGAGAKGATLLHVLDPTGQRVRCVVDVNPGKQGRYLPATGHPIVGPAALASDPPSAILLMNENYRAENAAHLAELGVDVPLLAIEDHDEDGDDA